MQVKCEYCGSYINDLDEKCPNCGATNEHHKRTADGTPKTIEQLQDWYKARNLPPEEVTRFFVGKNIREPKAFGVYEENGTFYVYKNKADGTRAIRYQGADEAYAVNELYMKLKEEILNQKRINLEKNTNNGNNTNYTSYTPQKKKKKKGCLITFIILTVIAIFAGITAGPSSEYYISNSNDLFYYSGSEWWNYNAQDKEWNPYNGELVSKRPLELKSDFTKYIDVATVASLLSIQDVNSVDIFRNHKYLDLHPVKPTENYYTKDGKTYYFLNDAYGSSYGTRDNTGWYYYNDINNSWEYYSSYDDKEKLGDLYYVPGDYTSYNSSNIYDFSNTVWYSEKLDAEIAHDDYTSSSYDWSSDSDWDWDSGSDWDSGGSDWDSDW